MARTANLTPEEAEALIGPRGQTPINSANRDKAKQWLSAMGVSSVLAARMKVSDMNDAYNDTTNESLKGFLAAQQAANGDAINVPPAVAVDDGSAGATLAKLVSPYLTDGIMTTVLQRVDAALANINITRIECVRVDGTEHVFEGSVHPKFSMLVKAMSSRMVGRNGHPGFHPNIMLCGPTGSGKTHAAHAAAKLLGLDFETNGALTMDYQVLGFKDAAGTYHDTPFRRAYAKACVYLFDEIDASDNNPLICLAGALANGQQSFPDGIVERHIDSVIIAAGNTWGLGPTAEFVGRARLDGMIRSRFPIRIHWGYDEQLEIDISGNPAWTRRVQKARAKASAAGMHVIIDPRMSQAGAALLASGLDETVVAELTYLANLDADQRRIVEGM